MAKKNAAKEEREYMRFVAELGCIACRQLGFGYTPAEVHHKRSGVGIGRRASHFETIPLCPGHHRHNKDAIHKSRKSFEENYGTEDELVQQTLEVVKCLLSSRVGG